MRRLSVDAECKGNYTCPAVWLDDNPDCLVIVGHPVDTVATFDGEIALRLKRKIVMECGFAIAEASCHIDPDLDYIVVVGEQVPPELVHYPNGMTAVAHDEAAVRVPHTAAYSVSVG